MVCNFNDEHILALQHQLEAQRQGAWSELATYIGSTVRDRSVGSPLHHELLNATRSVRFAQDSKNPRTVANFLYWEVLERLAAQAGLGEEWAHTGVKPRPKLLGDEDCELILAKLKSEFPSLWRLMIRFVAKGDNPPYTMMERRTGEMMHAVKLLYSRMLLLQQSGSVHEVWSFLAWKLARTAEKAQGPWG